MRAKSVAYSLACSSGQPWPGERQQRRVLEKVAAAPTSSRAPVGSTERGGGLRAGGHVGLQRRKQLREGASSGRVKTQQP